MSAGIVQLIEAGRNELLPFSVTVLCGEVLAVGRIGPSVSWADIAKEQLKVDAKNQLRTLPDRSPDNATVAEVRSEFRRGCEVIDGVFNSDQLSVDEVTLYEVTAFHAIDQGGGPPRQIDLDVIRIRVTAIQMWWIGTGVPFPGNPPKPVGASSGGVGIGVAIPLPF
jgi:hypothetical protein